MKALSKCTPREFVKWTNRIRKILPIYLEKTGILDIRNRAPVIDSEDPTTSEELTENIKTRNEAWARQARENLMDMLEQMLDKYPEETVEMLALICCVEPEDADNYTMAEYLACFNEIINDKAVMDFFISLSQLGENSAGLMTA